MALSTSRSSHKGRLTDILQPLPDLPRELEQVLSAASERGRQFRSDIRAYNSVLAFTSTEASLNEGLPTGGVYTFRIRGEMYHRIGSPAPSPREQPRFAQFYIIDTDNELNNRHALMPTVGRDILGRIKPALFYTPLAFNAPGGGVPPRSEDGKRTQQ